MTAPTDGTADVVRRYYTHAATIAGQIARAKRDPRDGAVTELTSSLLHALRLQIRQEEGLRGLEGIPLPKLQQQLELAA